MKEKGEESSEWNLLETINPKLTMCKSYRCEVFRGFGHLHQAGLEQEHKLVGHYQMAASLFPIRFNFDDFVRENQTHLLVFDNMLRMPP